jgi:hypothetical protein
MFEVVEMVIPHRKGTAWPRFCGTVFAGRLSERKQETAFWLLAAER